MSTQPLLQDSETTLHDTSDIDSVSSETRQLLHSTTFTQTFVNYVNMLLGLGLLSLPFAFSKLGWILSLSLCTVFCALASWTAILISRFNSMSEMGEMAFGPFGRHLISSLFACELFSACVALVILFADSLELLIHVKGVYLKLFMLLLAPTTWMGGSVLSLLSAVGLVSFVNLIAIVVYDGSIPTGPSWYAPAPTHLWPQGVFDAGMAMGLLFVGLDLHAVVPNISRAMEKRTQFRTVCVYAYFTSWLLYMLLGSCGYLMFGDSVLQEITQSIAGVKEFDPILTQITLWLIAVNPLTKFALTLSPVVGLWEHVLSIDTNTSKKIFRTLLTSLVVLVAILMPSFSKVMGLLGSSFSFAIAIVFPLACHLKLNPNLKFGEKMLSWICIVCGVLLGLFGTVSVLQQS
ncbi:transmembrane amino acid transporter protein-domain-containing protein [Gorgonomyces haynaldii]|nr:transmembrane amino acid transporter protein-domain-containing protein [Gorgonomyces haynaldii]